MPIVEPFQALRLSSRSIPDVGKVLATAYDAVDDDLKRRLLSESPHDILRLELPVPPPGSKGDRYRAASLMLREWMDRGVLEVDPMPSYYVTSHEFTVAERRIVRAGHCERSIALCFVEWADWWVVPWPERFEYQAGSYQLIRSPFIHSFGELGPDFLPIAV